jgi:hypothetical protein
MLCLIKNDRSWRLKLLTLDELKNWLHREVSNTDKVLLVLASLGEPSQVSQIKERGRAGGLRAIDKWNISDVLGKTKGLSINTPTGWELSDAGKQRLRKLGVSKGNPAALQVAADLRLLLTKIADADTRAFVEEAVECFELEFFRSSVVMSWLAAVHVLKHEVHGNYLSAFNAEARKCDAKWKDAKTTDEIGSMKEGAFLDRIAAISLIGKNVKDELQICLKLRNACGHPNSLKIGPNAVANHLEILLLNVFNRFY